MVDSLTVTGTLKLDNDSLTVTDVGLWTSTVERSLQRICYQPKFPTGFCEDYAYLTGFSAGAPRLTLSDPLYDIDPVIGARRT